MRKAIGIITALCLVLGLAILLYQPVSGWISQKQMEASITEFEQGQISGQKTSDTEESNAAAEEKYSELLADMQDYNETLYTSGQAGLVDAWSYEQSAFDLSKYGLTTDVVGVLDIPAMGEELPVYLGATAENMAKGVAVLGQTSMPVGGENTNCVIAGHRGYQGVPFFRDIEKLQPGDFVCLTTHWGKLTYQVESTDIILPDDIDAVLIQEGRDLLTLVTCHPYVTATHRYVVYCTAVEDGALEGEAAGVAQNSSKAESDTAAIPDEEQTESSSSQIRIQLEQWLPLLAIPLVILFIVMLALPPKKQKKLPGKEERQN